MAIIKCGYCTRNHESITCESLIRDVSLNISYALKFKAKLDNGGHRICGYCSAPKHWGPKCPKKFNDIKCKLLAEKTIADKAFEWLHEIGFGPGCMITGMARERTYRAKEKGYNAIIISDFTGYNTFNVFILKLLYGKVRNWYNVTATNSAMEKVKQVYLPYHPVYAPTPTSKRVEVLVKAAPEDIEKLKDNLECYNSLLLKYDTAEAYFAAGLKLKVKK